MVQNKMIVYEPGLPNTPGWTSLSEAKKEWLQEKNSNLNKFLYAEGFSAANVAAELYEIKQGLAEDKTGMGITEFLKFKFKKERTGFRRIGVVEDLLAVGWTLPMIRAIGGHLYTHGITANLGDILPIAKSIPAMKNVTEDSVKDVVENKIAPQLKEMKSARRVGKTVRLNDEDAAKILFNTGRRILRAAKGLHTSADYRAWLKTVVGWWMEDRGVPGTLECKRIPIPEGTVAKVGFPKGKKRAKKAVVSIMLAGGALGGFYMTLKFVLDMASNLAAN